MEALKPEDFIRYARSVEPVPGVDGSPVYRCAAYLTDGTLLPCVALASRQARIELATRRFAQSRAQAEAGHTGGYGVSPYYDAVRVFAAVGNVVNDYDIAAVGPSRFALPVERLREIKGETAMSWTQFLGVMNDGAEFSFGTGYHTAFFDMPDGYDATNLARIIPNRSAGGKVYRERPFFTCYVDGLPGG